MQKVDEKSRKTSAHRVHEPFRHTNKNAVDYGQKLCQIV
jgi:hypothetical protein